jgi:hypothetical protein
VAEPWMQNSFAHGLAVRHSLAAGSWIPSQPPLKSPWHEKEAPGCSSLVPSSAVHCHYLYPDCGSRTGQQVKETKRAKERPRGVNGGHSHDKRSGGLSCSRS